VDAGTCRHTFTDGTDHQAREETTMPVINLDAGQNAHIPVNTIPGSLYIYVTGQNSYAAYQCQVGGGPNWNYMRPSGDHERIQVNNQDVQVGNNGPARIQVLYSFAARVYEAGKTEFAVLEQKGGRTALGNSAEQAMQTLTAQYYNAVVAGCGLSATNFQLYQTNLPLGDLSENLWHIFDAIPPLSVTQYYDPTQLNILSQNYGAVINHLNPQNGDKFQAKMADYYPKWVAFLKTNPQIPKQGGILALFKTWSELNMPPDLAQDCYTLYAQIAGDAIVVAVQHWIDMQTASDNPGIAAYDGTIEDLKHALEGGHPKAFTLNSETESSDISHTWAKTDVGGILDFFWGGGSANYQKWTENITSSGVTIKISFDKLVPFVAGPLYEPSTDPVLQDYTPWYEGKALSIGYHHNDNTIWQHGAPTWADTFGPDGDFQRFCAALIVVDGVTLEMESSASIAKAEQEQFETAIEAGFFPFFEANGSGGWSHQTTFNDNGSFKVTSSCVQGNPVVMGVLVSDVANIFGASGLESARKAVPAGAGTRQPVRKALAK
jgi:hypothetical protein